MSSPSGVESISSEPAGFVASEISAKFTNEVPLKFASIVKVTSTVVQAPAAKAPRSKVPSAFQSGSLFVIPAGA